MCPLATATSTPGLEQLLLDGLRTSVLFFDPELCVQYLNPAAEALLDVSATKVRGTPAGELFAHTDFCHGALRWAMVGGNPLTERDMRFRTPGGRMVTVDCTLTPISEPRECRGILVELTHLERHKRITREEQLVVQNETARTMVRGLAHEIRNPLGGLRGAAQLLERELPDDSLREYTGIIIREADRLQKLMDRLLGPRSLPQKRSVNVHEVTERVRALIRAESPDGIQVDRDYDPSIPEIHADPELLIQAILNVARNAVQAMGDTGRVVFRTRIHRQYTIGQRRHRLVVRIDVTDDGPGVPETLRETIFYPMVTGRASGTGLGLSIAQTLVNQHGGLIECSSSPGETTFSILLPSEKGS